MDAFSDYDGLGLAELVAKGEVTPLELVDAAIQRIERHNPALNAVVYKAYDEALKTLSASFPAQFVPLAADRRGDVLLLQGKRAEAAVEFGKAYQGLAADAGEYRRLVGIKLNALGIDPEAGGTRAGATS